MGFFSSDCFVKQEHLVQSATADEEINYHLSMLYFPEATVQQFAAPKAHQAPTVASRQGNCASSSRGSGEARSSGSSHGLDVTKAEEDFLSALGIHLNPTVPEKECGICRKIKPLKEFISTRACAHDYCMACCEEHAERRICLTTTSQIDCPFASCGRHFSTDQCKSLLSEASFDILSLRLKEAATLVTERVYCPFLDCSLFVPVGKRESRSDGKDTFVECHSCLRGFCLECNVPWERECSMLAHPVRHNKFIGTKDCAHEFCIDCCKQYAEREILGGSSEIQCPHPNCGRHFDINKCKTLLSETSFDILNVRLTEAATPVAERIYCPFSDCYAFIPVIKPEFRCAGTDTFVECHSCHRGFCLECNVPWEKVCGMCSHRVRHTRIISTKDCAHEYCTDCCKQHAERDILSGGSDIPCPHLSCGRHFDTDQCETLLSEANFRIYVLRQMEAAIPASERVYCAFQDCSSFIPVFKLESSSSVSHTLVECNFSCHRRFCLECKVPWERECDICADSVPHNEFICTEDCDHGYCAECCKRHAETKILSGSLQIDCPDPECRHNFHIEQSRTLLSQTSFDILSTRLVEAAFSADRKVYCPFQGCSVMMEKPENSFAGRPLAICYSCKRDFCLECNVPWHTNMTCGEYRADIENTKHDGDQKLRDLAKANKWRVCPNVNCKLVVERTTGCNHMTCRCKTEFCYRCVRLWENKKATCTCKLYGD